MLQYYVSQWHLSVTMFTHSTGFVHASVSKTVMASSEDTLVLRSAVEFGFHSVHGPNIKLSKNGLLAERKKPSRTYDGGVVYGAKVLRGITEFEVEMISYGTGWSGTLYMGVMQCKAGSKINHSDIPLDVPHTTNYCICYGHEIYNNFVGYSGPTPKKYSSTDLENLRKGDRLGLQVSHDGVLTFFVNGKSQGVAAQGVYQDGYDLYPVVDVFANCKAVRITRAGMFTHLRNDIRIKSFISHRIPQL